ncbi:MAG TPA: glycosyltransferase [Verrucomicrobiae bacterium]|nr:glycosyltransferase [Verrucomicrobiae bacterium]
MDKLHIAIVHRVPLPAKRYGGTERTLWWLAQAFNEMGHRVSLVLPQGSQCPFATVIPFSSPDQVEGLIPKDADVVQATYLLKTSKPFLMTMNGNAFPGEKFHPNTVFVSRDHARRHKSEAFVYPCVRPEDYPALEPEAKEPFCMFLAKARWKVKNVKGAIDVSRAAGVPIRIIGGWRPSLSRKVRWLGWVDDERKKQTLKNGSALLFPVRWHEPFGVAIFEAMVTGSPVFGTPYGSLPELVPEGTGFLSSHTSELANALKKYDQYDRQAIRKYVLDHYTPRHMAEKYLEYSLHVMSGKTLNPHEPEALTKVSPLTLLDWEY